MSRYTWARILFLILGLLAAALTLVPLTSDVPLLTSFLLVLPIVILLVVLGLAMFVGWQRGAIGALFGTGILAALAIGQADQVGVGNSATPFWVGTVFHICGCFSGVEMLVFPSGDQPIALSAAPFGSVK